MPELTGQPPTAPAPDTGYDPVAYWNDSAGRKWAELQVQLDLTLAPLGLAAIERAGLKPGEQVVDLGCGTGDTSLELAARVGPAGSVLGLDISQPMLEVARSRGAGQPNLQFLEADAANWQPAHQASLLFSRFGVMFFPEPHAAFAHLRQVLPTSRLVFVCWRAPGANPWLDSPRIAAEGLLTVPPTVPRAPGPFAFAESQYVRELLEGAGWRNVGIEPDERPITIAGGELEDAVRFGSKIGPAASALAGADAATRAAFRDRLREIMTGYLSGGLVQMPAATWIVTAEA